jgi:hypothetical protein
MTTTTGRIGRLDHPFALSLFDNKGLAFLNKEGSSARSYLYYFLYDIVVLKKHSRRYRWTYDVDVLFNIIHLKKRPQQ